MLTKKDKKFLNKLLNRPWVLQAMASEVEDNDEEWFIKNYWVDYDDADKILDKLFTYLTK